MPRSIWKGAISFGLVAIPIRIYTATGGKELKFNFLHAKDQGRIFQQRRCSVCGEEVPWEDLIRGFEYQKGQYVTLNDEELNAVPIETTHTVDIVEFVPLDQVDPIYMQKSYFIAPEAIGVKAYKLLRDAMRNTGKAAVAKVVLRTKEHLALLRPYQDAFVLETMYYGDEIQTPEFEELERKVEATPQEMAMAESLIENLTEDFHPENFDDRYREALLQVIEKKVAGEEIVIPEVPEPAPVIDLMEALKASVDRIRSERDDKEARAKSA